MIELVVTRHPALVEYLKELKLADGQVEVVEHATPQMVSGKHVCGVLPHSLSCLCASFTEVPLSIPQELRGKELSLEQIRQFAGDPMTYEVNVVDFCGAEDEDLKRKVTEYIRGGGNVCLHCGSTEIEGEFVRVDSGCAFQPVHCNDCGQDWEDVYELAAVYCQNSEITGDSTAIQSRVMSDRISALKELTADRVKQIGEFLTELVREYPDSRFVPDNLVTACKAQSDLEDGLWIDDSKLAPSRKVISRLKEELCRALTLMKAFGIPSGEQDHVKNAIRLAEGVLS